MTLFLEHPELLPGFIGGEPQALDAVYRAYRARVDGYLLILSARWPLDTSPAVAVADIRQEVFLRAFLPRVRAGYDPTRRYAPYLLKITKHYFIDAARSRQRQVKLFEAWPCPALDEVPAESPEFQDQWVQTTVRRYLTELPPRLRAVYDRRYVCDESQESACVALGLSRRKLRTAEERLKHGLRRALLRRELPLGTRATQGHLTHARCRSPLAVGA
jgi:RNA polymerase sigma-70 factor (ECF subfamily)